MKKTLLLLTLFAVSLPTLTAQSWEKYKAEDLQVIANFPEKPTRTVQKVNTAVGELDMHMVMYAPTSGDDNLVYSIIRSDYPKEQFEDSDDTHKNNVLDGAVNGAVTNVKGTLEYHNKVTFNGYPGRRIKISIEGAFLYLNAVLVENTMFITQVICVKENDENASIKRFTDSFDIIKIK